MCFYIPTGEGNRETHANLHWPCSGFHNLMNPSLETDVRGPAGEYAIDWKSLLWPCNKLIHWPVAISQLLISLRKLDAICVLLDDQAMMGGFPPSLYSIECRQALAGGYVPYYCKAKELPRNNAPLIRGIRSAVRVSTWFICLQS